MRMLLAGGLLFLVAGLAGIAAGETPGAAGAAAAEPAHPVNRIAFLEGLYSLEIPNGWLAEWDDDELSLTLHPPERLGVRVDNSAEVTVFFDASPYKAFEELRVELEKEFKDSIAAGDFGPPEKVRREARIMVLNQKPAMWNTLRVENGLITYVAVLVGDGMIYMGYQLSDKPEDFQDAAAMDEIFRSFMVDDYKLKTLGPILRARANATPPGDGE